MKRDVEMTRLLLEGGVDTRGGIWPNSGATSPRTIAEERGYDEIVAMMVAHEERRGARWADGPPPFFIADALVEDRPDQPTESVGDRADSLGMAEPGDERAMRGPKMVPLAFTAALAPRATTRYRRPVIARSKWGESFVELVTLGGHPV